MKPPAPLARPISTAIRFRAEIEKALSEGVALDDMDLYLSRGDAEKLKRDRAVALTDISFVGGTMTFLGVKVSKGADLAKGEAAPPSALRRKVVAEA